MLILHAVGQTCLRGIDQHRAPGGFPHPHSLESEKAKAQIASTKKQAENDLKKAINDRNRAKNARNRFSKELPALVTLVKEEINSDLAVEGYLLTMYDARTQLSR